MLRHNPGLIEERTGFKSNEPTWDKAYLILIYIFIIIWCVSVPLDAVRFHWSQMPAWLHLVGAIVLLSSFYLFYLTFRENSYLSLSVRIQEDRGQTVVSTGPYRYVRHPMYTGMLLFFLGSALLLGSWIGVLLGLCLEGTLARRAVREECELRMGLKGYDRLYGSGEISSHPSCLVGECPDRPARGRIQIDHRRHTRTCAIMR
jgi:protein-S-isoprenylcysteine O-methyltransferase Ste14